VTYLKLKAKENYMLKLIQATFAHLFLRINAFFGVGISSKFHKKERSHFLCSLANK
jgi:hypothetical protein